MPSGLSVTAARHAGMFHISGGAVSLMLMCVQPCGAAPGTGMQRGAVAGARLVQLVTLHSFMSQKRPKIPSGDTVGQKTRGANAFGSSGMDDFP